MEDKREIIAQWIDNYKQSINALNYAFGIGGLGQDDDTEHGVLNSEYSKDDFITWMSNPDGNKERISEMSRFFYGVSPSYGEAIRSHAEILTLDYDLIPNFRVEDDFNDKDLEQIKKSEDNTQDFIQKVANKPQIRKIIRAVFKEGLFCGYLTQNKKEVFIQTLPRGYARYAGVLGDGFPLVEFNFEYFDDNESRLEYYPREFKSLYNKSKTSGSDNRWLILDPKNSICILAEEDDHTFPRFIGMIPFLLDEEEMVELVKKHARLDAIRMVAQIGELDSAGNPTVDPALMQLFQEELKRAFGGDVAVANTLFDIKPIEFSSKGDGVSKQNGLDFISVQKELSSGTSGAIAGDREITTEAGLKINYYSMIARSMAVLEKIELWLNYQLRERAKPKKYPFKVKYLPIGNYVKTDDFNRKSEVFALGGLMGNISTSMGLNSTDYENSLKLEKLMQSKDNLVTPESAHTQSGKPGRPEEE